MIAHYLAAALAKLRTSPVTTAANVLTLALGLACFIAAYGIATYWRSADMYHRAADRTFVIGQSVTPTASSEPNPIGARSTATLAKYLVADLPEIDRIARVYQVPDVQAAAGENAVLLEGAFAEPAFLQMFDLTFLAGDPHAALDEPGSVVLTADAAVRLFGDNDALGKAVLLDNATEATVTGVIAPVRQPSFMGAGPEAEVRFDMLGHWNVMEGGANRDARDIWVGTQGWTFVTLAPGVSVDAFNARLPEFLERRVPPPAEGQPQIVEMRLEAFPISEITTRGLDNRLFAQSGVGVTAVSVLLGLGVLTLVVACANYANLATALAASRSKEVGLRKVLGAGRVAVMAQSWLEAMVLTLSALLLALGALALAAPAVEASFGVNLLYFLTLGVRPLVITAGLAVAVGVLAGAYPALVLSRVHPAEALRTGRARTGPRFVARLLVAVQFATASFLLIVLTVAQLQRDHLDRTALAPHEDPIVVLNDLGALGVGYDALADDLRRDPRIQSVTSTDREPWGDWGAIGLTRTPEPGGSGRGGIFGYVGHDYFSTMRVDILAGRVFDRERETVSRPFAGAVSDQPIPVVLDWAFAEAMGFATPDAAVGELVYVPLAIMQFFGGSAPQPVEIIGVVETDLMQVGATPNVTGRMYFFVTDSGQLHPIVRLSQDDVAGGLAAIEAAWSRHAPNTALDVRFLDEVFEQAYREYARISQLFTLLAATAFIIASVGQLGIAVHVARRRRHEIGVRKTLGSTTLGVARLLLVDFSKPALIANLLAWPLGYVAAQAYLSGFAHRIDLTPAPFALSMAITLAIAWAAVIGEVLKAASVRPAEVLRHA